VCGCFILCGVHASLCVEIVAHCNSAPSTTTTAAFGFWRHHQVIIMLMIGVLLEINVADGVPLVLKAEPRPAIIAFLVATVWEFIQIEWMVNLHEELFVEKDHHDKITRMVPAWYRNGVQTHSWAVRAGMWLLVTVATGLFLSGSILDAIRFTSVLGGETAGCVRSYNLYEIGTTLVSDFFLLANDAAPGVWTMSISYLLFLAVFPLYCHFVHLLSFFFNIRQRHMCLLADQCWTFASVEVLVLAIFTVEVSCYIRLFRKNKFQVSHTFYLFTNSTNLPT